MNYYPFHIGDYLSATRHLSWEEDAAYRRLLDTYYTSEKPLPTDLRAVCRLVLATTESQREAVRVVLEEFFELTDAGWINSRADSEIEAMREKQQKQRDKANKRWHKPEAEHGNAPAMPQHKESDAAAQKGNAVAMPPTPTPTPTPIKFSTDLLAESEPLSEFAIPLIDGTDFKVPERTVGEWTKAYPAVDVPQELREMRTWALANKAKRKTKRGIEAFVVRWLGKAQDTPSRAGHRQATEDWTGRAT